MTTMIIDNKATAKKPIEKYIIDRNEYPTKESLYMLAGECMNKEVYLIKIYENDNLIITARNDK